MGTRYNCQRHKQSTFLKVLAEKGGHIGDTCKAVKIARSTYNNWCKEDLEFKAKVDEVSEREIDDAESQLRTKIREGDLTAIIFYLKTKGRKRGYCERQQIELQEIPSNTYLVDDDEDAKAFAEAEKKGL